MTLAGALATLALHVVAMMAFSPGLAQAETGAKWIIGGVDAKELPASVQVKEVEKSDLSLLTKLVGISTEFLCTGAELVNVELIGEGKVKEGGKAKFTGCVAKVEGEEAGCSPHSSGKSAGTIETLEIKGEIVLHEEAGEKIGTIRIEPKTGETLATILTSECVLPESNPVRGKLFLKDASLTTLLAEHLLAQGPLTELWLGTKTTEHAVALDGSAKVKLSSPHETVQWCGAPG